MASTTTYELWVVHGWRQALAYPYCLHLVIGRKQLCFSDTLSFTRWSRRQRHIRQHPTQDACVLARTLRDCKRKAEDVDITPPDSKTATFAVPGASHVFSRLQLALRHATRPNTITVSYHGPVKNSSPAWHRPLTVIANALR